MWDKAPMTQEDAFLRAIFEAPEDDTPRLVFADWLEEEGDLRYLWLDGNSIGEAGALAESPYLAGLVHLSVKGCAVGKAGYAALRDRFGAAVHFVADDNRGLV